MKMKLINGLYSDTHEFLQMNDAFYQAIKKYPQYQSFLEYLKIRYEDSYDLQLFAKAITKKDIETQSAVYLRKEKEYANCMTRLYGPFFTGKDTDEVDSLLKLEPLKRLEWILKQTAYTNDQIKEMLNQSKTNNIYDFYHSLYFQRLENPKLEIKEKDFHTEEDEEFILWNYVNLRHEQDHRPLISVRDCPKEEWKNLILKYQKDEIEDIHEPNDIQNIFAQSSQFVATKMPVHNYEKRLTGAIMARFAGCMLGAPVENWSIEQMEELAKNSQMEFPPTYYWKEIPNAEGLHYKRDKRYYFSDSKMQFVVADDDVTYTVLNALVLEKHGYQVQAKDIALFWKDHLPYACTAEYATMVGLRRNQSIEYIVNSNPYVELIGAAIRADCFGYVCPGNPYQAALLAYEDAKISHKRNGIYGEMFLAATIAASFSVSSSLEAIRIGMNYIPDHCRLKQDLIWALSFEEKLKDFKEARKLLDDRFLQMNRVHTNNNMCAIVFSLILGKDNFNNAISSCIAMGYDNDCTGASVGSILGALLTIEKIDKKWYEPFHNEIHTYIRGYETLKITELVNKITKVYHQEKN